MQQFYENLQAANRRQVIKLFDSGRNKSPADVDRNIFVPFNQERDKLGRLIFQENHQRPYKNKRNSLPPRIQDKNMANPQSKLSLKVKQSNITVEKIFKMHGVKGNQRSASLSKLKILSNLSRQNTTTPTVGQYDSAHIADKMKYQKSKITAITVPKIKLDTLKKQNSLQLPNPTSRLSKRVQQQTSQTQKLNQFKKIQINYDLPELQMYHQMKKLKMKHYDNFEQDHLRFKQLARYSLVLANQLKKSLKLD